jgi:oleate hydratase
MHAAYGLLGVDRPIPPVYHALSEPKVAFRALETKFMGVCQG